MIIERVGITGFGKLRGCEYDFSPGFNLIYGPNEAGKTTFQTALKALLYGFKVPDVTGVIFEEDRERLKPWSGERYEASLQYRLDSGDAFHVVRNFETGRLEVRRRDTGEDITASFDVDRTGEALFAEAHTGVTKRLFTSTAFIPQARIENIDDPESLVSRVHSISSREVAGDPTLLAIAKLRRLVDETGADGSRDKPLGLLRAQLAELQEQRRQLDVRRQSVQRAYNELQGIQEKRKVLQKRRDQLLYITRRLDVQAIEETLLRAEEIERAGAGVERELKELDVLHNFPLESKTQILKTMATLQVLEKERRGLEDRSEHIFREEEAHHREMQSLEPYHGLPGDIIERLEGLDRKKIGEEGSLKEKNRILQDFVDKETELEKIVRQSAPIFSTFTKEEDFYFHIEKLEQDVALASAQNNLEEAIDENRRLLTELEHKARGGRIVAIASGAACVMLTAGAFLLKGGIMYPAVLALVATAFLLMLSHSTKKDIKILTATLAADRRSSSEMKEKVQTARVKMGEILNRASVPTSRELITLFQQYCVAKKDLESVRNYIKNFSEQQGQEASQADPVDNELKAFLVGKGLIGPDAGLTSEYIENFKRNYHRYALLENEAENLRKRKDEVTKDLKGNVEELELWKMELEDLFTHASVKSLEEFDRAAAKFEVKRELEGKLAGLSAEMEAVLKGKTTESLLAQKETALTESGALEEENPPFREIDIALYRAQHEEYSHACVELAEALAQNYAELQRLEGQRISRHETGPSLAELQEKIDQVELKLQRMEENSTALTIAMESIAEVQDRYMKKVFSPELNSIAGEIIKRITASRYDEVEVEGDTCGIRINVKIPETQDIRPVSLLSKGTVDQMYFVMKLALIRLLTRGGERLPLILDDVFANYDYERRRRTFEFLLNLSRDNQIVLFTPDRYQRQELMELLKIKCVDFFEYDRGTLQFLGCRAIC